MCHEPAQSDVTEEISAVFVYRNAILIIWNDLALEIKIVSW